MAARELILGFILVPLSLTPYHPGTLSQTVANRMVLPTLE